MLSFYQHLPENIGPIAFSIGSFPIRWYSIMYLIGFLVVYFLLRYRIARGGKESLISNFQFPISKSQIKTFTLDFMLFAIAGLLIGARLGYVLFYNFGYYFQNPLSVISPYDFATHSWTGIFGMSYFGGAIGIVFSSLIFTRKNKLNFWSWADFVVPAVPAGYFFGRIGNFLNGELYGRITEKSWGMYFPSDALGALRHPSQLYEAFFEGLILFLILWFWRSRIKFPGQMLAAYLFFYGLFRFGIEFFREADPGAELFWGYLTLGQLFSLAFISGSMALYCALSKQKKVI